MKKLTFEQKLEKQRLMKIELAELKAAEMELRIEICEELGKGKAANKVHHFEGIAGLKVDFKLVLNYKINKTILETLELTEEEAECIIWTPTLSMTKFKQTDIDVLDEAITIKSGAPTLTVELL